MLHPLLDKCNSVRVRTQSDAALIDTEPKKHKYENTQASTRHAYGPGLSHKHQRCVLLRRWPWAEDIAASHDNLSLGPHGMQHLHKRQPLWHRQVQKVLVESFCALLAQPAVPCHQLISRLRAKVVRS